MAGPLAHQLAALDAAGAPAGTAHLSARVPAKVTRRRALAVLRGEERGAWLGEVVESGGQAGEERHLIDLELRVSEQSPRLTFKKAAYVDVGPARARRHGPIEVAISWRAAGLTPLFPVFSGTLAWVNNELSVQGYYAPPGGGVGLLADRLVLNVAARATARLLLERIAAAMRGEPT